MHNFGSLVYLEMQKSGSTYVNTFLNECCKLTEIKHHKHSAVRNAYDPKNFYFITIRHPLALYSSLYRYGLDQRGIVYHRMKRKGKTSNYESFESFMQFVLDPSNASTLEEGYNRSIAEQIGFMSFRFMKLSLQFPLKTIERSLKKGGKLIELEQEFITDLEIKNEELKKGLKLLATEKFPEYFDKTSVHMFLGNHKKINASKTARSSLPVLSNRILSRLLPLEALLLSRY